NSPSTSCSAALGSLPVGPVAEWPCRGLQIPVRRFDSGPGLHKNKDLACDRCCEKRSRNRLATKAVKRSPFRECRAADENASISIACSECTNQVQKTMVALVNDPKCPAYGHVIVDDSKAVTQYIRK